MAGKPPRTLLAENERLTSEVEELRLRLEEAEQALEAIRTGQVDSIIVEGPHGTRIFALEGADNSYRILVEGMNEGAATLGEDGAILYCNRRFAEMLGFPIERVMGSAVFRFLPDHSHETFEAMLREANGGESRGEMELLGRDGAILPAHLSVSVIHDEGSSRLCLIAADLRAQKRNEEIVAAEQLARSVIEQAAEAIVVCDDSGRIIRASAAAGRLCGTDPLLRMFDAVFALELSTQAERSSNLAEFHESTVVEAVLRGGEAYAVPAALRRQDGAMAHVLVSATSLRGADDRVRGCVINLVDVTDSMRSAEALRASDERLRFALEGAQQGIWDWDAKTKAVACDERTTRMLGLPQGASATFEGFLTTVHEDDRQRVTDTASVAIRECTTFQAEYRVVHPDGAMRWLHARSKVFCDDRGEPDRMSGTVVDITERKHAEENTKRALAEAESGRLLLDAIMENVPEGITIAEGPDVRIRRVSRYGQMLTGKPREVLEGISVDEHAQRWEIFAADGVTVARNEDLPLTRATQEGEVVRDEEWVLRSASGERTPILCHASPIRDSAGAIVGGIVAWHDITERRRVEAALRQLNVQLAEADRRKNDFLAVLSHELRNPLAPITNSLFILDHAPPGSVQAERATQVIGRQVTHLSNLVNDLLDVTRITNNKVRLQKERLELNALVRRSVEDNRSLFEQAGVRLEPLPEARPVPVHADSTRMAQVLGNLLQNSAKFTSRGGQIRVSVAVEGGEAVLRVADDGVGMSRETLDRLFQPFAQAEQGLERSKGGLGLGLALVKGLVELHGGSVSARSDGLGRGVEMIVRLPLDSGAALEAAAPRTHLVRGPRRVLIIEDNADAACSLSEFLAMGGHEVAVACDGLEGIAKAREFHPDVVLCDIGLPGMDGYDVARVFRSDEALKGIFLVAFSGYALPEDLQRAAEAGFQRHLAKPLSLDKLEQILAGNSAPPAA